MLLSKKQLVYPESKIVRNRSIAFKKRMVTLQITSNATDHPK